MNNLPTTEEYQEYLYLNSIHKSGLPISFDQHHRFLHLETKAKNIKFPATIDQIYKQLNQNNIGKQMKILTIGQKHDITNDSFENLLWFINHCNVPMTDNYVYSTGFFSEDIDQGTTKYTIICLYKETCVVFKQFNMQSIPTKKEITEKEAKLAAYYHLMNQFLLWTGPEDYSKMINDFRQKQGYAQLIQEQQAYTTELNNELAKVRRNNLQQSIQE